MPARLQRQAQRSGAKVVAIDPYRSRTDAIRVGVAIENHPQGGQAFRAIFSLAVPRGSWRRPAGGVVELSLYAFPVRWETLSQTEWMAPGTRVVAGLQLGRALTGGLGLDPPVKALMVCNANPLVTVPEQDEVIAGLSRDDLFTVLQHALDWDAPQLAGITLDTLRRDRWAKLR